MKRYIDADITKATLKEYCVDDDKEVKKWYDIMGIDDCIDNNVPTADVRENVRGEWIEDKKAEQEHQLIFHKVWTCSQCGERQCRPKGSNFCPNCGADMRGDKA